MGQGEPLDNYAAVLASLASFTSPHLFHLSPARITVSTVGVVPRILSLITDAPHVQLALSLHAPTQPLRLSLVPSASAYTLPRLLAALHLYTSTLHRRVLIEYILIADVNCSACHAVELVALLQPLLPYVAVNVIPFNGTAAVEGRGYESPGVEEVMGFRRVVQEGGVFCTVRQEMGRDVQGACGQLALNQGAARGGALQDIEDCGGAGLAKPKQVRRPPGKLMDALPVQPTSSEVAEGVTSRVHGGWQPGRSLTAVAVGMLLMLLLMWLGVG